MTKEQIAAIAVVLLLGAVFFVRLYRRQQEAPNEPPKPKPLPKIGKMRCPMCGAEAKVTGKQVRRLRLNQIKFGYKNNPVKCG